MEKKTEQLQAAAEKAAQALQVVSEKLEAAQKELTEKPEDANRFERSGKVGRRYRCGQRFGR